MSPRRFSLDANILVYAVDRSEGERRIRARDLVDRAARSDCWITVQALGEFFHVCTRKEKASRALLEEQVEDWLTLFPTIAASAGLLPRAMRLSREAQLSFWDALLIATVGEAECGTLLSEDMQDGMTVGGVTVRNPFLGDRLSDDLEQLFTT